MTRGNQREIDRQRAAKRHANDPKSKKDEPAFASVKRQERDAEIMRQKQKEKDELKQKQLLEQQQKK